MDVQNLTQSGYFIAFLFSVLNAQMDEKMHYADRRVEGWYKVQKLSSTFEGELIVWHVFNIIRIISSLVGWLLIGFDLRDVLAPKPIVVEELELLDTSRTALDFQSTNNTTNSIGTTLSPQP